MNRSLEGIYELLVELLGNCSVADAQRIDAIFAKFPDFWFDPEADRKLRTELYLEVIRLTGDDGNGAINVADKLIRDQAGLPRREDDTDPVYDDYKTRAGDILLLNDGVTEIKILGPCPSSSFRWAAVMNLQDEFKWLMSWVVINQLTVKQPAGVTS